MSEQRIVIDNAGNLLAIYNDDLADLLDQGEAEITRVSHVEPCSCGHGWRPAMVGGPDLGCFRLRSEALAAETEYLTAQLFD